MIHIGSIYKERINRVDNYYLILGKETPRDLPFNILFNIKTHNIIRRSNLEIEYYFELIS